MTLREQYLQGLLALGYSIAVTNSKKYILMQKGSMRIWLGKSGAVRFSNHFNRIDASIPASEKTKQTILEAAK